VKRGRRVLLIVGLATLSAAPLGAQSLDDAPEGGRERARLEQRVRTRLAQEVRARLQLNDDQMRRLGETNERYEARRRELLRQERVLRSGLRDEMQKASPDEQRVARLLDELLGIQRRRLDLVEQEQRDLAAFMTPTERAKYLVLQDQVRRRIEELRRQPVRRPTGR
jgi:periplasmic protein CpxP/Spy